MDQEEYGQVQLQDQHHSRQGQGEAESGDWRRQWFWGDYSLECVKIINHSLYCNFSC